MGSPLSFPSPLCVLEHTLSLEDLLGPVGVDANTRSKNPGIARFRGGAYPRSPFSRLPPHVSHPILEPPPILTHTIHTRQKSTPPDVLDFPTLPHALVRPFHLLLLFSACAAFHLQAEKRRQQDACCGRPCLRRLRCYRHWDRRLRCGSKPCRMRSPVPALMTGGLRPPLPVFGAAAPTRLGVMSW